jgi:hypothetical protein
VFAATIRGIGANWAQLLTAGVFAASAIWSIDLPPNLDEDWRAAAAIVREQVAHNDTPVLLHSGYTEGEHVDWLSDPERSSYLNAPASMYPMGDRLIALPYNTDPPGAEGYLEGLVTEELADEPEFLLVVRGVEPYSAWFSARLVPKGYSMVSLANLSGQIQIFRFTRDR